MNRALRLLLCGIVLSLAAETLAQSVGGPYTMRREAIAGGGGRMTASPYVATATVAQPAASGPQIGGSYRLTGGFHGRRASLASHLFCDGFEATPCP